MRSLIVLLFTFLNLVGASAQKASVQGDFTYVDHCKNNVMIRNFDNSRSNIFIYGSTAILTNADGTTSTLNFWGIRSNLILSDGSKALIMHNGNTSLITLENGEQYAVNHVLDFSSNMKMDGVKHTVTHNFIGRSKGSRKTVIDILAHMNWVVKKKQQELTSEIN